jgi:ABC-2 type transport system ATP-binding protein
MILNILVPDSGSITVLGRPANESGLTDRLGYLPEERGLYRKMRVRSVLKFLAALKSVPATEANRRIDWWLERLGLRSATRDWGDAKVEELSRGMQQKVQFIGALLHDPELVILDEPFSGLDPVNTQALQDTVLELRARGRTVILSTHIIANAESMCDAVCIIAGGTKLLDGSVADVKTQYGGPPVERTVLVQPSLHDIFLQQVGAPNAEGEAKIYG